MRSERIPREKQAKSKSLMDNSTRLFAPPTGLEPVTLRLTVECSAN